MNRVRGRPRILTALALGLALVLGLAGGAIATSFVVKGGPIRSIKVATADTEALNGAGLWLDVPNMSVTLAVPSGEQGVFVATFSAVGQCAGVGADGDRCQVRALIDGQVMVPGPVDFMGPSNARAANSMQWLAGPWPAGTHTIKIQFTVSTSTGAPDFYLKERTLSVERAKY